MSKLELKTIMLNEDGNASNGNDDVQLEINCSDTLRKTVTYKLFDAELLKTIEEKLILNDNILFCGFKIESEHNVTFMNDMFNYKRELKRLRGDELNCNYLVNSIKNKFWMRQSLAFAPCSDNIKLYVPANSSFSVPKIKAMFVRYDTWVTGCVFKKKGYALVDENIDA